MEGLCLDANAVTAREIAGAWRFQEPISPGGSKSRRGRRPERLLESSGQAAATPPTGRCGKENHWKYDAVRKGRNGLVFES